MANDVINFTMVRTASADIVMAGNEVNQTLTLTNKSQFDISNIYIVDTLSQGISFKNLSVYVDGTSYPGYNPVNGFTLQNVIKASNSATITYKVLVDSDPPSVMSVFSTINYVANGVQYENEKSNTLKMELASGELSVNKTSDKSGAKQGEKLTYQIEIQNVGNVTQNSVVLKDQLPSDVTLVSGTVKVDGEVRSNVNLASGFTVGNIYAKEKKVVTFDVTVN